MPWAALAVSSGLSAAGGILGKSSANEEAKTIRRRTRASVDYSQREQAGLFDKRGDLARSRETNAREGYSKARQEVDKQSYAARRDVLDREDQTRAQIGQTLLGVGGTSAINAYRGLSEGTSRQLANVDRQLGSIYAGLTERETQAVDRARGALDSFYQDEQDFTQRNRDLVMQSLIGASPSAEAPDFGGLVDLFSAFSGGFGGGGQGSGSDYYGPGF